MISAYVIPETRYRIGPNQWLSDRRREIWVAVCEGMTTKEIALIFKLSPKTIEYHRAILMKELGVDNIAKLTRLAVQKGLITI